MRQEFDEQTLANITMLANTEPEDYGTLDKNINHRLKIVLSKIFILLSNEEAPLEALDEIFGDLLDITDFTIKIKELEGEVEEEEAPVSTVLDALVKCATLEEAHEVFERMVRPKLLENGVPQETATSIIYSELAKMEELGIQAFIKVTLEEIAHGR